MNRAERRAQFRNRFCRGGTPWPPHPSDFVRGGRPRSVAPTVVRENPHRSVVLHIEELVLHGFPMQGRHAISDATQQELTRLLSATGLPDFVTSDAIDGGTFNVTPQAKPGVVGSLIAKAIYSGGRRR